jgi:[acyl-carrier-protein] S-malonyltransferase
MPIAILCSGQGQQHPGMFDLVADVPEAATLFDVATDLLGGRDPRNLVRLGVPETLEENRTAQILCVLKAVALQAALGDTLPARRLVAGYSVGEVAAWALAGLISGVDALTLVAARAEAMDAASHGPEGLTFVRGLARATIDALCDTPDIAVAIVNPGDAFVLGGTIAALDRFEDEAVRHGAKRVVRLNVHIASHTRRLAAASTAFATILARSEIRPALGAGVRLYAGVDGAPVRDAATGIPKLADQISHTVEWARCVENCVEAGATTFLELGPGHALSAMVLDGSAGAAARSAEDFKSLSGLRNWIGAQSE